MNQWNAENNNFWAVHVFGLAHKILNISLASSIGSYGQSHQSLYFLHTQNIDVEECSDQKLDILSHWILQFGCLKEEFAHTVKPV